MKDELLLQEKQLQDQIDRLNVDLSWLQEPQTEEQAIRRGQLHRQLVETTNKLKPIQDQLHNAGVYESLERTRVANAERLEKERREQIAQNNRENEERMREQARQLWIEENNGSEDGFYLAWPAMRTGMIQARVMDRLQKESGDPVQRWIDRQNAGN